MMNLPRTYWLRLIIALLALVQLLPISSAFSFADILNYFTPAVDCRPWSESDGPVGIYDNFKNHPCKRKCLTGISMVCIYNVFIHAYSTFGPECKRCPTDRTACEAEHCIIADGEKRTLMLVNHQFPSPTINVCKGDIVVAHIYNNLLEPTTEHWHGIHMEANPESDGAPYITDYPISPGVNKTISFVVDRSGTVWYHSHIFKQRAQGVAGIFIVRDPKETNPHHLLYDYDKSEHSVLIQDIGINTTITPPTNLLVNGMGRSQRDTSPDNDPRHRYARFFVEYKKRYRFRFITNIVSNCPVIVTCDGHRFTVIALDGNDIKPVVADSFHLHAGERIDCVIHANQKRNSYWCTFEGLNDCRNMKQKALLIYEGISPSEMPKKSFISKLGGRVVNAIWETRPPATAITDVGHINGENLAAVDLESVQPITWTAQGPFTTVYLRFGVGIFNDEATLQINHISFLSPEPWSMLQACHIIDENAICNATSLAAQNRNCLASLCNCTHVIQIPQGVIARFVIANMMGSTHPVHMHGVTFSVVGQGVLGSREEAEQIETLDRQGDPRLKRMDTTIKNPVRKDVIQLPPRGFVVYEVRADNTGFWLLHCHIEIHAELGMMLVVQIGDPCPMKQNLPKKEL